MRKLYTIMFFTILLLLVGTVIFLILSPDQIPVHMSISGGPKNCQSIAEDVREVTHE